MDPVKMSRCGVIGDGPPFRGNIPGGQKILKRRATAPVKPGTAL
jgi:hypothetical protein